MPETEEQKPKSMLTDVLIMGFLIYAGLGLLLFFYQRGFIYYPTPEVRMEGLLNEELAHSGESIRINVLNPGKPSAIIYFGGNAEAVAYNAPEFSQVFPDFTSYFMNYRGYGGSSGKPSEAALYADALALYDQVHSRHEQLVVMGRSLGTGVATYLAANRQVYRLVLITPFDSIQSVASSQFPIYPVGMMLKDKYDSISRVPRLSAPALLLIARNDEVINASHGRRLAAAFPADQVEVHELGEAGHNTISYRPEFYPLIRQFLDK